MVFPCRTLAGPGCLSVAWDTAVAYTQLGMPYIIGGQAHAHCLHTMHTMHIFKTGKTTENKTLKFRSRKGGDGIRPFKLRVIRRESVKLRGKGGDFNV